MADDRDRTGKPALRVLSGGTARAAAARMSDEALVAAFLVGDDGAFGDLVGRHERLVLSLVRRYARTADDARDLAQRTFLRAYEAARRTIRKDATEPFPFKRWLVRIALNVGKNHVRDEMRVPRASLESLGEKESQPATAERTLEQAELAAAMRRAVLGLPRRQREVLTLRIDGELPFADIAAALGITENAAKVTFHHATRKLRSVLGGEGRS